MDSGETPMTEKHARLTALAILLTCLMAPAVTWAAWPYSEHDFNMLPPYCKAKFDKTTPADKDHWAKRIGPDFQHVHHYCAALHSLNVANATPDVSKSNYLLGEMVNEIQYVEKLSAPTFFLRAEMSVQKGRALARMKKLVPAMEAFNAAIKLNGKFSPAYAGLADVLLSAGQKSEAIKVLEKGIAAAPGSKSLHQRLARLK